MFVNFSFPAAGMWAVTTRIPSPDWEKVFVHTMNVQASFSAIVALLIAVGAPAPLSAQGSGSDCAQPKPVCDARKAVFPISAFDPVASAVRIGPAELLTTRHAVADEETVQVFPPEGPPIRASVVPSAYEGDIVLLRVEGLPPGPSLSAAAANPAGDLFTVGVDVTYNTVRVYPPGRELLPPAEGLPLARLHHTAYSQPGNSGGALVDGNGDLVGIVSAGGEGRFEAVPVTALPALRAQSGAAFRTASAEIGKAIRVCTLALEDLRGQRGALPEEQSAGLAASCRRTGNRQYFDNAAQAFGMRRDIDRSVALFEASLAQDPNALNARLGLAVTYHLAGRYEEELEHLRFLTAQIPNDPQVIRLSIQAGVWGDARPFAEAAFERLKATNPNMAEAARRFLENPPPRPPRR